MPAIPTPVVIALPASVSQVATFLTVFQAGFSVLTLPPQAGTAFKPSKVAAISPGVTYQFFDACCNGTLIFDGVSTLTVTITQKAFWLATTTVQAAIQAMLSGTPY